MILPKNCFVDRLNAVPLFHTHNVSLKRHEDAPEATSGPDITGPSCVADHYRPTRLLARRPLHPDWVTGVVKLVPPKWLTFFTADRFEPTLSYWFAVVTSCEITMRCSRISHVRFFIP